MGRNNKIHAHRSSHKIKKSAYIIRYSGWITVVQQLCYHDTEANTEALYVGKGIHTKLIFPIVPCVGLLHCNGVIMGAMASQITSITSVYSTVYPGTDKKIPKLRVTGLCEGNSPVTGELPTQRASNAENFSFWWRHHGKHDNLP